MTTIYQFLRVAVASPFAVPQTTEFRTSRAPVTKRTKKAEDAVKRTLTVRKTITLTIYEKGGTQPDNAATRRIVGAKAANDDQQFTIRVEIIIAHDGQEVVTSAREHVVVDGVDAQAPRREAHQKG